MKAAEDELKVLPLQEALAFITSVDAAALEGDAAPDDLKAPEARVSPRTKGTLTVEVRDHHSDSVQTQASAVVSKRRARSRGKTPKQELVALRSVVSELEGELRDITPARDAAAVSRKDGELLWKSIARLQRKELTRAEDLNRELRRSVEAKMLLFRRLRKMLSKRQVDWNSPCLRSMKHTSPFQSWRVRLADDAVFEEQLMHVECADTDVESQFQDPAFTGRASPFTDLFATRGVNESADVGFQTKAGGVLPFSVYVTGNSFWRALATDWVDKYCYFKEKRESRHDLVAQSAALRHQTGDFDADLRVKYTIRRCMTKGRVVFVWKSVVEPTEINHVQFRGLKCHYVGSIMLKRMETVQSTASHGADNLDSTSVLAQSKLTVEFSGPNVDQERQVRIVEELVRGSHNSIRSVCTTMIYESLLREHRRWSACQIDRPVA